MASTDKPAPEPEKIAPPPAAPPAAEPEKAVPPPEAPAPEPESAAPPPPQSKATEAAPPPPDYLAVADVILRVFLFAAALVAVVVMVSDKQTEIVPLHDPPYVLVPVTAKFRHYPAFVYFVAALSVAGLYSIITIAISFFALLKPGFSTKLLPHFVIFDVLILGIVAAATGSAAAVAYTGLKGNSHVGWVKICNVYDKFCQHLAGSIVVSLFAAIVLVLLVILSAYSLSKKIPK